jgi:hypothetical protein
MSYDLDICTAAQRMIKRYGDDAIQQAGSRASDLLDAGDVKGAYIWHPQLHRAAAGDEAGRGRQGAVTNPRQLHRQRRDRHCSTSLKAMSDSRIGRNARHRRRRRSAFLTDK